MMRRSVLSSVASLVLISASTGSQQQTRPSAGSEIPTLQEAIDSAPPGAVLKADDYGPPGNKGAIHIGRPLTLMGGIYRQITVGASGRVILSDLQVSSGNEFGEAYPALEAFGSDLLLTLVRCQVSCGGSATYALPNGSPALVANNPDTTLLLIGSTFQGSIGGGPGELTCEASFGGRAAVEASNSVVYAWKSEFRGGGGIFHRWDDSDPGPCPGGPVNSPAAGGPGLVARYLWHRESSFIGGPGAYWDDWPFVGPDGPGFIASWHREVPAFDSKTKPR